LPHFGECARVHSEAGDAAPFLNREIYELLNFEPRFDSLPARSEFETRFLNKSHRSQLDERSGNRALDLF